MKTYERTQLTTRVMTIGTIFVLCLLVFLEGMWNLNYDNKNRDLIKKNKNLIQKNMDLRMELRECNDKIITGTCLTKLPKIEEL